MAWSHGDDHSHLWGSKYQKCLVFKWLKPVQLSNGPVLVHHLKTRQHEYHFVPNHLKTGHFYPIFEECSESDSKLWSETFQKPCGIRPRSHGLI